MDPLAFFFTNIIEIYQEELIDAFQYKSDCETHLSRSVQVDTSSQSRVPDGDATNSVASPSIYERFLESREATLLQEKEIDALEIGLVYLYMMFYSDS